MPAGLVAFVLADGFRAGALLVEALVAGFAVLFGAAGLVAALAGATFSTAALAVFVTFSATALSELFADAAVVLLEDFAM
ncbi:hypothetical protein JNW90_29785 [Micromonospora sp. STR1s_5]|nr:hypothetical protein [Micromonospora sp. STR1s_5]